MSTVILAPHLEYPLQNGADIYVERLGRHLSSLRGEVILLGTRTTTHYKNAAIIHQESYKHSFRSKPWAAIRTLVKGSHYFAEKFLTPAYRARALEAIADAPDSLLICSFISSASLLNQANLSNPAVVLTLNDEIAWFQNQRQFSGNTLQKWTAWLSERWAIRFLGSHANDLIFAHICESDEAGYRRILPTHRAIIVPAGVDIGPLPPAPPWDGKIRLLFCGALSVNMNYAALVFFKERFWPIIKNALGDQVEMWVAGSLPTRAVQRLCRAQGWQLYPNLPDKALRELLGQATFSVLPFPYTTGAKLKLLNSLAAGLPVLGTANMLALPGQEFPPNCYSDEAQDWLAHLGHHSQDSLRSDSRLACQQFASRYRWDAIAEEMSKDLREHFAV